MQTFFFGGDERRQGAGWNDLSGSSSWVNTMFYFSGPEAVSYVAPGTFVGGMAGRLSCAPRFQAWRTKGEEDRLFPAPGILGQ